MLFQYQLGRPQRHPLPRPSFCPIPGTRQRVRTQGVQAAVWVVSCSADGWPYLRDRRYRMPRAEAVRLVLGCGHSILPASIDRVS
jgi:hypothetical protein